MRYWVDGYNVILRSRLGEGSPMVERRGELLARIAASGFAAFVAFDSREHVHGAAPGVPRRVEVAFGKPGKSADDLLLDRIRRAPDLHDVTVVSDDRDIADRAPMLGVRVMGVAAFARMLKPATPGAGAKGGAGERKLSKNEVDDWMQWFGKKKGDGGGSGADDDDRKRG